MINKKRVVICGGHLTPALALIEEFEKNKNLEFIFFGRKFATEGSSNYSAEYKVVKAKKLKFFVVNAGRIQRKFTKYTLLSLLKIPLGFVQSFFYLAIVRPHLIVSFGGYLSTPVVFCGWLLGITAIAHEQSVIPGFATKANSLFVKEIFVSWGSTARYFESSKVEIIGNLVRKSIFRKNPKSIKIGLFLKRSKNLIFISGGNQGSHFINNLIFDSLNLLKDFYIIHQVGTANFQGDFDKAKKNKLNNYLACDYIDPDDIGAIINKAKVVVSRSGANTVWELGLLKKPAILIPLPLSAGGEQLENAKILERAGFVKVLNQTELPPEKFIWELRHIFNSYKNYFVLAESFQMTLPKDAKFKMAKYVNHLLDYT